jgi:hypothetical protein
MDYKEILKISNEKFSNFLVVEKPFEKYGISRKRILIKRFIDRLGKYFIFAEITNLVIGTTTVDEVWVINYSIGDKTFDFTIESDLEEITLGLTLDWYLSAIEVEKLRTDYYNKYTKIKTDLKSEIRDYKLNKVL